MSKCGGSSPFDFAQGQNDGVKQTTTKARTKTEADPYGMTNKRTSNGKGKKEQATAKAGKNKQRQRQELAG
jgi:hypothetical protein